MHYREIILSPNVPDILGSCGEALGSYTLAHVCWVQDGVREFITQNVWVDLNCILSVTFFFQQPR